MTNHLPRIAHALILVGAIGAVVAPVTLGAVRPAGTAAVPVPGKASACRPEGPKLLKAGGAPRVQMRIDLSKVASVRRGIVDVEKVQGSTRLAGGKRLATRTTRKIAGVFTTRAIGSNGRLPFAVRNTISFPGAAKPKPPHNTFSGNGYFTALNGGAFSTTAKGTGGTPYNDHFPAQAVGIGAIWRVVNCNAIDLLPARETRLYTLRSTANGTYAMTYRDDVEIDPAHVELASLKVGRATVTVKLLSLHGSAKGTMRVPAEAGLAQRQTTISKIAIVTETSTGTSAPTVIHSTLVDTATQAPST